MNELPPFIGRKAPSAGESTADVKNNDSKKVSWADLSEKDPEEYVLVRKAAKAVGSVEAVAPKSGNADVKLVVAKPASRMRARVGQLMRGPSSKEMALTVPFSFSVSCDASGIVNGINTLVPDANATEWNDIQGLFDEYIVDGARIHYNLGYSTPVLIPGAATLTSDYCHVLVFDPTDQTALASVRQGTEAQHHKLSMPKWRPVGTVAAPGISGDFDGEHVLKFRAAKQNLAATNWNPGGTIGFTPAGQWLSMAAAGSNGPFGALKSYGTSWHAASKVCVVGIIYVQMRFRVRK
jgi:hypothetical protein